MVIIFLHDLYNWLNCKDSKFHVDTLIRLLFIAKMPGIDLFETVGRIVSIDGNFKDVFKKNEPKLLKKSTLTMSQK